MDVYTTEEEQIAAMKKWWRENWKSLAGGVLIGLAILYGGKTYFKQQDIYAANASSQYEAMLAAMAQDKKDVARGYAETLLGQYVDTPYAVLASLSMAKLKVDENDLVAAKSHLRWALDHTQHPAFKHVARLRLARVLLAEGKADEALGTISNIDSGSYVASYEELKGDIYVAKGQIDQARNAYTSALAALKPSDRGRNFVEMKLDDLGELKAPTEAS